jgi:hypothetical protein
MMFGGPNIVVSTLIGKHGLFKRILEEGVLGIADPGARELMFVKAAEFHEGE